MVLYIDNFRGFKETVIPVKDVNFLVGENSTGKTSILKLLKLLSDPNFWMIPDFTSDDFSFHLFSDLCDTKGGKPLFIGISESFKDKGLTSIVLKFADSEGMTMLKGFRYINQETKIDFEVEFEDRDKSKIRFREIQKGENADIEWFTKNSLTDSKYEYFSNSTPLLRMLGGNRSSKTSSNSIVFTISQALDYIGKKTKTSPLAKFRIPTIGGQEVVWSAPIRSEPRRTYDNYLTSYKADGSHIPYILRGLLSKKKNGSTKFLDYINSFGAASGLFEKIIIKEFEKSDTSPFEVDIVLNKSIINLINVGYGVSQVLPILVEILTREKNTSFALQQPEIHLHPKGQAAMGDFLYNSWMLEEKKFFIETHSDFLIDRFRFMLFKNKKSKKKHTSKCQVLFFSRTDKGNKIDVIDIKEDGRYSENRPEKFRDFFIREEMNMFSINL